MSNISNPRPDLKMFARQWLAQVCARSESEVHFGVLLLSNSTGGSLSPAAVWPEAASPIPQVMTLVERTVSTQKPQLSRYNKGNETAEQRSIIALPLLIDGDLHGIVAIDTNALTPNDLDTTRRHLEWYLFALEAMLRRVIGTGSERLITVLNLVATALHHHHFMAAATAVVTELATILQCERVCIGFLVRGHTQVMALSHSASFADKANLIRHISACMDEAIDQEALICYPTLNSQVPQVTHFHSEHLKANSLGAICTVPFAHGKNIVGAMTLDRPAGESFDAEALRLCEYAALLLGPLLDIKRRDDQPLHKRAVTSLEKTLQHFLGPQHTALKLGVVLTVVLMLFFAFAKGDFRVTADATLEGAVQRAVSVPISGFVSDAFVRAGDIVKQGDPLFTLDDRDLRLERLKWLGQQAQYKREYSEALAARERAKVNILNAQIEQADAQLALVDEQLQRTRIVAPFDSYVVSGDLSQSLGAPVERGEVVFEVAPLADYRVLLAVDERDIDALKVTQQGLLSLNSLPGQPLRLEVARITPVATPKDGANTFEVEARILGQANVTLRPGMQGVGKINIDERRLIWIWSHRIVEWWNMLLWTWWP